MSESVEAEFSKTAEFPDLANLRMQGRKSWAKLLVSFEDSQSLAEVNSAALEGQVRNSIIDRLNS